MRPFPPTRRRRELRSPITAWCFVVASLASGGGAFAQARGDFNGDGFDDLAVGVRNENIGSVDNAGAVNVIYGTSAGLSSAGNQFWNQDVGGILDTADDLDSFGWSLASGDFDADGFDDLAIGIPLEVIGGFDDAGAVCVVYGTPAGLSDVGNQFWHQDSPGILDDDEALDNFGHSLTSGDFDGDGFDDLAIGAHGEQFGSVSAKGAVHVLFGTAAGLSDADNEHWTQDSPGVLDDAEDGDTFGDVLTSGDFNGDGFDDLVVGVPLEDLGAIPVAGVVHVLFGTASGLSAVGNQLWHQDAPGVPDGAEDFEAFGYSLASGDFNGDGFDDLAVGSPFEDIGTIDQAGAAHVIHGSATGLSDVGVQFWHQDAPTVPDVAEAVDRFGISLAAGEFTGDGRDDLVVGVMGEDQSGGAVHAFKGTAAGLSSVKFVTAIVEGGQRFSLEFGAALGIGDYNGDGLDDIAVGVPTYGVGTTGTAGSVTVLAARKAFPKQFWNQNSPGILDSAEISDRFGSVLGHN